MDNLFKQLSSYHILNFVIPGGSYIYLLNKVLIPNILSEDWLLNGIIFYIVGLIISRIGSVIIAPKVNKILEYPRIIKVFRLETDYINKTTYEEYIKKKKKDTTISDFVTMKNMFRSMISVCFCMFFSIMAYHLINWTCFFSKKNIIVCTSMVLIGLLFLFSYEKQGVYIQKRIKNNKKGELK